MPFSPEKSQETRDRTDRPGVRFINRLFVITAVSTSHYRHFLVFFQIINFMCLCASQHAQGASPSSFI